MAIPAAQAAPLTSVAGLSKEASVVDVRHRHHGYYGGRHYNRGYYGHRRHNNGAAVAAGVAGLAFGVLAGQAMAQPRYYEPAPRYYAPAPRYYAPAPVYSYSGGGGDWLAYCSARFRSFDPRSGTYLGYDGRRHYCR
jgi:hypothetical protein